MRNCVIAITNLVGATAAEGIFHSGEKDKKQPLPKPLPSTLGNSASMPPEPPEDENHNNNTNKVNKIIKDAQKGRETKGRVQQYEKIGGIDKANAEFDSLNLKNVKSISYGRVGQLSDGTRVIVRSNSTDGRPTLEIQYKNPIKIRYSN